MRAARVQGVSRRKFVVTTPRDRAAQPAPDLVQRHFPADDALPERYPFGPPPAPAPPAAAHPKFLRVVDHCLYPENPAGFRVPLQPVRFHAGLDPPPRPPA